MAKRLDVFVRGTFEVGRSGVSALEVVSSQRFLRASLGAGHPTAQLYLRASCLLASRGNLTLQRPTSVDLPSGIFLASVSDAAAGGGVHLFLASANSRIVLLLLRQEEEVLINASVLLAFDPSVTIRSSTVQFRPAGSGGGGGGAVVMQGPGMVALTVRGAPLTVGVEPNLPILRVQPQMTLGWTTNILPPDLRPALMVADGATAGAAGRTEDSDNKFQLNFNHTVDGNRGYVILQPNDDNSRNILATFRKLLPTLGFFAFRIVRCILVPGFL